MGDSVAAKKAKAALETKDVLEMLSEFFREAAVLVLVFLPLEQSKGVCACPIGQWREAIICWIMAEPSKPESVPEATTYVPHIKAVLR